MTDTRALVERLLIYVNVFASDKEGLTLTPEMWNELRKDLEEAALALSAEWVPVGERNALIRTVAIAMCKHWYTGRSFDEYVAPGRELWQRYEIDATIAVDALLPAATAGGTAAPKGGGRE